MTLYYRVYIIYIKLKPDDYSFIYCSIDFRAGKACRDKIVHFVRTSKDFKQEFCFQKSLT